MILDCDKNIIPAVEDLGVIEAQHGETMFLHESVSSDIVKTASIGLMRVAIDFND